MQTNNICFAYFPWWAISVTSTMDANDTSDGSGHDGWLRTVQMEQPHHNFLDYLHQSEPVGGARERRDVGRLINVLLLPHVI